MYYILAFENSHLQAAFNVKFNLYETNVYMQVLQTLFIVSCLPFGADVFHF